MHGPFRICVYFAAVGQPTKWTLDDGSWASRAALHLADPPPRRGTPAVRVAAPPDSQAGLLPHSNWAGPRRNATPITIPASQSSLAAPPTQRPPAAQLAPSISVQPPPPQPRPPRRPARSLTFEQPPEVQPSPDADVRQLLSELREELTQLRQANNALREEMREVRRENNILRQQLEAARGNHSHQPYLPPEDARNKRPADGDPTSSPSRQVDNLGDQTMSPGGAPPDPKQARIQAPEEPPSSTHGL